MIADHSWDDKKMENFIGNLLRAGVVLSALVVLVGAIIYLARHGNSPVSYRAFRGEPAELITVAGILRQTVSGRGRGMIQLGLLVLIATPVARVAFSIFAFAKERDYLYTAVASIVLLILLYSLAFS
jgi:uncharacterized membrane protein